MSFDTLGLRPELLRAVATSGYTEPTPIQARAIPTVLAGRDLLAAAQTGTGKTAAFVLPLLERLHATSETAGGDRTTTASGHQTDARVPADTRHRGDPRRPRRGVRALVLAPTRELALQVEESVRTYGTHAPIRSAAIYGGVGYEPQVRALRNGAEIVVATPGRLLDHIGQRTIDLSGVEVLVLDEADRMLDMGFIRDIRRIQALLPQRRQNLLFSATFSADIRALAVALLDDPVTIDVSPRITSAELVEQVVIRVDRGRKRELLTHLARSGRIGQALVFTRTKHGANRLAELLARDGIRAAAIHGNKSQSQRVRALADFKAGRVDLLVATDVAARGIDIDALPHVVNFELPTVAQDHVHRIGRTGRAGVGGEAISLVCVDEEGLLQDIQAILRRSIPTETVAGFEPDRSIRPEPIRLRSGQPSQRPGAPAARHAGMGGARGVGAHRPASPRPDAARPHAPRPSGPRAGTPRPGTPRPGTPRPGAPWPGAAPRRPSPMPGERLARGGAPSRHEPHGHPRATAPGFPAPTSTRSR